MWHKICARFFYVPLQIQKYETRYVLMRITGSFPVFSMVLSFKPYLESQCSQYTQIWSDLENSFNIIWYTKWEYQALNMKKVNIFLFITQKSKQREICILRICCSNEKPVEKKII